LRRNTTKTRQQKYNLAGLRSEVILSREQRKYRATSICHRRQRLRLPNTEITRQRRRKSGLVAFVHRSLNRPRTLLGRKHLFLPPVTTYNASIKLHQIGGSAGANTLTAYKTHKDALPIFWKRPHNRANSKAISALRRRRYNRYKRYYRLTRQKVYHHTGSRCTPEGRQLLSVTHQAANLSDQKILLELRTRRASITTMERSGAPRTTIKFISQGRRKRALKEYTENHPITANQRTMRYRTPVRSNTIESTAMISQKQKIPLHKLHGL